MASPQALLHGSPSRLVQKVNKSTGLCSILKANDYSADFSPQAAKSERRADNFGIEGEHSRRCVIGGKPRDRVIPTASSNGQANVRRRR